MRGEDGTYVKKIMHECGSPPHARGRHGVNVPNDEKFGITPACAGKTFLANAVKITNPDHPRMRGEDLPFSVAAIAKAGSPPHARGRLLYPDGLRWVVRITPACAGKTNPSGTVSRYDPDHPRMRGEDREGTQTV